MTFTYARRRAGLLQRQVAERLSVSMGTVAMWDTGRNKPRADMLPKIAKLYGVSVDELLADNENEKEARMGVKHKQAETLAVSPPISGQLPVFEHRSQLVADSRDVAAMLERSHKHLVRSIRTYCGHLTRAKIGLSDFFIATYRDETGRTLPRFLLTEMGCEFVANKATGEKGTIFTALYVKAFHSMRDELTRRKEQRAIGKPIRRSLTDALRDSGEAERMKGHAYSTYTNLAYQLTIGKNARQLRQERGATQDAKAVDFLTAAELELYQKKEAAIAVLLDAGLGYDAIKAALLAVWPERRGT